MVWAASWRPRLDAQIAMMERLRDRLHREKQLPIGEAVRLDVRREAERYEMGARIRSVEEGPDGALYFVLVSGQVGRIVYEGALPPTITQAEADVTSGPAPLTVYGALPLSASTSCARSIGVCSSSNQPPCSSAWSTTLRLNSTSRSLFRCRTNETMPPSK